MAQWESVLDQLVRTRRGALVGYACLLTADRAEAERLTSRALVQAFAVGRRTGDVVSAEVAVRRALRSGYLTSRRLRLVGRAELRRSGEPTDVAADGVGTVPVGTALARLGLLDRVCTVMAHVDQLEAADIAAELRLSETVVRRHLADGAAALRLTLGSDVHVPETGSTVPVSPTGAASSTATGTAAVRRTSMRAHATTTHPLSTTTTRSPR